MKPSNYILVTFFVFIVGCSLVLFISARSHKNDKDLTNREYPLDDVNINVIVAESEALIRIHTSDTNSLSIYYPVNEREPENFYRVSNDTLYVSRMILQNQASRRVDIYIRSILSSVVAKSNSDIRITSFFSDKLEIYAEQALVDISNFTIDEMVIQTIHSNISIYSTTETASVSAKLERESNLRINSAKNVGKVNIEKDESSRYSLY
jgi:hypothetical protein